VELVANRRGYNVIIGLSNESFAKEVINMEMLANGSIDGFILSISKETQQLQDYHHFNETMSQGIPIVMFDRVVSEINCDKVIVDDFKGAKTAVEKLIENNCKHIALITTKDYVSVGKLRTQGYLQALEEHKMTPMADLILKVDDTVDYEVHLDALEAEIERLFKSNKSIDGVFAVNELYALSAMKVARKLGLEIPNDVQVIGFTDGVLSKHATPSLSTVSQHAQQMGEAAADLLIDKIESDYNDEEEQFKTVVIATDLIERDSTK
jgi:LacI family transcriptional regulator